MGTIKWGHFMTVGTCTECGNKKELGNRSVCEACRKRAQRRKGDPVTSPPKGDPIKVPAKGGPVIGTSSNMTELTETDKLFEADRPGYYIYDGELETRSCFACDRKFSTRLKLLKACSPDCQQRILRAVATNT